MIQRLVNRQRLGRILIAWWLIAWSYTGTGFGMRPTIAGPFQSEAQCKVIAAQIRGLAVMENNVKCVNDETPR